MSSKQVVRGTFGQDAENWYSYFRTPEGNHSLSTSSKIIGSVRHLGNFQTKREMVKWINVNLSIEVA